MAFSTQYQCRIPPYLELKMKKVWVPTENNSSNLVRIIEAGVDVLTAKRGAKCPK